MKSIFSGFQYFNTFDDLPEYFDNLFGPSLIICVMDHTLTFQGWHPKGSVRKKDEENNKSMREKHQIPDESKKKDTLEKRPSFHQSCTCTI